MGPWYGRSIHEISLKSPFVQSRSYGFLVATFFGTLINRLRQHYESFSIPGSIVHTFLKKARAHTKLLRPIRHPFHFGMGFGAPGVVSDNCLPGELLSINKWAKRWPRSARKKPFEPWSKPFQRIIQGIYRVLVEGLLGFVQGVVTKVHLGFHQC